MRSLGLGSLATLLWLAPVVACAPPSDLGHPCVMRLADGGVWTAAVSASNDFLYQGTPQCQNLICLRPAGSPLDAGYGLCSAGCTPETPGDPNSPSSDCGGKGSGSVCRAITDPAFAQQIEREDGGQALLDQYLGGSNTAYCAPPQ